MSQATTTTDHDEIRRWAEERGGRPSVVRTGRGRGGILRFDFGEDDEKLEETSWEEFFQIFDDSKLAFLHQDEVGSGGTSRFFKFVSQGSRSGSKGSARKSASAKRASGGRAAGASKRASSSRSASKRASKAGASKRSGGTAKKSASQKRAGGKSMTKSSAKRSGTTAKGSAKRSGTTAKSGSKRTLAGRKGQGSSRSITRK